MEQIYHDLQQAIDFAFVQKKYVMKSFDYLRANDVRRADAQELLRSSLIQELYSYVTELNLYLKGGNEPDVLYAREAYGYLSKPDARKIATYLDNIIDGIRQYIQARKGGTKKPKPRVKSK
jgi:hypothetical protein